MSEKLESDLKRAVEYEENHGEGRVVREVLYALEREYGADVVAANFAQVAEHDSAFAAATEEN